MPAGTGSSEGGGDGGSAGNGNASPRWESRLRVLIRRSTMHTSDYFSSDCPFCERRDMHGEGRAAKNPLVCFFNSSSDLFAIGANHLSGDRVRNRRFDLLFADRISRIYGAHGTSL